MLEYLAELAEGNPKVVANEQVRKAFVLDSPTSGPLAGLAGVDVLDPFTYRGRNGGCESMNGLSRFANLHDRLAGRGFSVDVSVIGNERDWVNGGPIPGVPYYSFKAGDDEWGEIPGLGGVANIVEVLRVHGLVQTDPWVSRLIKGGQ